MSQFERLSQEDIDERETLSASATSDQPALQPAEQPQNPVSLVSFKEAMQESPLLALGLIDEAFITSDRLTDKTKSFLTFLSRLITEASSPIDRQIIDLGILTSGDFQDKVISNPNRIDVTALATFLTPGVNLKEALPVLVQKQFLTQGTFWNRYLRYGNFYADAVLQGDLFDWNFFINSGIVRPDQIGTENEGFDTPEAAALKVDLLGRSRKSQVYPIDKKAHPLVLKLRGQESTQKMSKQIEVVPGLGGSTMEDLDTVFRYYLPQAALYAEIARRDLVSQKERLKQRAANIRKVNEQQLKRLEKKHPKRIFTGDIKKRYFDIYARYGHGQMDPLQLAFIAKTAEWYIMGGRSLLFNSVRITPYYGNGDTSIPYTAHKACKGSELNVVAGSRFRDSHLFANRTFLTHSDSRESQEMESIPIIGLATESNEDKRSGNPDDYVVFNADFDPEDQFRPSRTPKGVNGDIVGLINESLRTMLEVEKKEIARAEAEIAELEAEVVSEKPKNEVPKEDKPV